MALLRRKKKATARRVLRQVICGRCGAALIADDRPLGPIPDCPHCDSMQSPKPDLAFREARRAEADARRADGLPPFWTPPGKKVSKKVLAQRRTGESKRDKEIRRLLSGEVDQPGPLSGRKSEPLYDKAYFQREMARACGGEGVTLSKLAAETLSHDKSAAEFKLDKLKSAFRRRKKKI